MSVSLQTWMLCTASEVLDAATSLFVCAFNLPIALGTLPGGLVADAFTVAAVLWLGAFVVDHDADRLAVLGARVDALWRGSPPAQTLPGVASLALTGALFEDDAHTVRRPGRAH